MITPCDNGEFCCSALVSSVDTSCCTGNTFQASLSLVLQTTSSATQPTSFAASCAATVTGDSSSSHITTSCPKNKTVAVSASVGALLGSILLATLATMVLLWRKLRQERQQYRKINQGAGAEKMWRRTIGCMRRTDDSCHGTNCLRQIERGLYS